MSSPTTGFRLSPQQLHLFRLGRGGEALPPTVAVVRVEGALELGRLETALGELVAEHEILRTRVEPISQTRNAVQVIDEPAPVSVVVEDWDGHSEQERRRARRRWTDAPGSPPKPFGARLVSLGPEEQRLVLTFAPFLLDARGIENLVAALADRLTGRGPAGDDEEPLQYADLAEWRHELLEAEETAEGRELWRAELAAGELTAELPVARTLERGGSAPPEATARRLPDELATALDRRAAELGTAPEHLLLAAWQALLFRLGAGDRVTVGLAHEGRGYEELEDALGLFAAHLPSTVSPTISTPWSELVERAADVAGELAERAEAWSWDLAAVGDDGAEPHAAFCFGLAPRHQPHEAGSGVTLTVETAAAPFDRCHLGLTVARPGGSGLEARLEADPGRYPATVAGLFLERWERLLGAALAAPTTPLGDLPIMGDDERTALVERWGRSDEPLGEMAPLHRLVARRAAETPEHPAVVDGDRVVDHRQLAAAARQLRYRLEAAGVEPGDRVGLVAERSVELLVAILAVLERGAAYVPLDPAAPRARLEELVADADIAAVVAPPARRRTAEELAAAKGRPALAPSLEELLAAGEDMEETDGEPAMDPADDPDRPAYVLYTSGSTGRPKGVVVPHRAIVRRLLWMRDRFPWGAEGRVLQKTPPVFDASIWELFVPLLAGGVVVVAPPGTEGDPRALVELVGAHRVTVLQLVPSMLGPFLDAASPEACPELVRLFCGGEALSGALVRRVAAELPGVELVNLYGPTETAIDATYLPVLPVLPAVAAGASAARLAELGATVPIGRPLAHARVVLVDRRLELVPLGVDGELAVAGEGLAHGYLGRPARTAEAFVPDPFSPTPGGRLYRTGDLARMDADGLLHFLGRRDAQVKLRGYRVELGEIESILGGHPEVREVAVTVDEDRLVAYMVGGRGAGELPPTDELERWLGERVSPHMVPRLWMELPELPRLASGKLDRNALPEPRVESAPGESEPPRGQVERLLAVLWSELLGSGEIGRHDEFFALGGHSILATQLAARVREVFRVDLPLRELFGLPRLVDQAARVERLLETDAGAIDDGPVLEPVPRDRPLPLSFGQQRLWFLERLTPGAAAYNLPAAVRLEGRLEPALLERALSEVMARHEVLRTTFEETADEPVQVIHPPRPVPLPVIDLSALPEEAGAGALETVLADEVARPFDLARGPLLRARLVRLGPELHAALLGLHHAVSDGWSSGVLVREIATLYRAFRAGRPSPLTPLPVQYADYAVWQRSRLAEGDRLETGLAYWRQLLAGAPDALDLPTDRPRPPAQSGRGARQEVVLPADTVAALARLCRAEGVTSFMAAEALFAALLARLSGQDQVVVGTPVALRERLELEGLIGLFANTVVLVHHLEPEMGLVDLVRQVRERALEASAHQELPFERLVEALAPARDLSRTPLFQAMMVLENRPLETLELDGLAFAPLDHAGGTAKFDLELLLWEGDDRLEGFVEYSTDLFDPTTLERWSGHLARLAEGALAEPERPLVEIPLLGAAERRQIEERSTGRSLDVPSERPVASWIAEHAAARGDRVAVACGDRRLTWTELDRRSAVAAGTLAARGAGPGTVVALLGERGLDLLVAVLGVLRTGAAYLPLDPNHPEERRQTVLASSGAELVVAHQELAELADPGGGEPLAESRAGEREGADDPAYVLYTSGSTGVPKGAVVTRRGMVNHLFGKIVDLDLGPDDVVAQTASQCFDISVWQMLTPLVTGGRVEIFPDAVAHDPGRVAEGLVATGVTVVETVPSLLQPLLERLDEATDPDHRRPGAMRFMVPTGEALPPELARDWLLRFPGVPLVNAYGPTECSDDVTHHLLEVPPTGEEMPIGQPLPNLRVAVVDRGLRPVPLGVVGQLVVGGVGVGGGYLGEPRRTAPVFVPDPFAPFADDTPGARLYLTGDLGRLRSDGELIFLGRLDHQVKIRGFRIELGEIEAALAAQPEVDAVVVVARDVGPGDRRLVAYLAGRGVPDGPALAGRLRERLPESMVPAAFVTLDELPLTDNGKVDRKALPEPDLAVLDVASDPPRTATEELVAELWRDLLGVDRVGRNSDFFGLGGHSLLAIRGLGRLRETLGVDLPLVALFEAPTVAALAARIDRRSSAGTAGAADAVPLEPVPRTGDLPLSPAQERLWFLDRLDPESAAYNVNLFLRLRGPLDLAALERAFAAVVERHEVLRTVFPDRRGRAVQEILATPVPGSTAIDRLDLSALEPSAREAELRGIARREGRRPFDLARGPLVRLTAVRLADDDHALMAALHHIVSDGWSLTLFTRELVAGYGALLSGESPSFPPLAVQVADHAVWQRRMLDDEAVFGPLVERERERLAGAPQVLDLPTDHPRPPFARSRGGRVDFVLSAELAEAVASRARAASATPFMVLAAAFAATLERWTGQDDLLLATPVDGRDRPELEGLIGLLVNTLVLRAELDDDPTGGELVARLRDTSLAAQAGARLPFEDLLEALDVERDLSRAPLAQAMIAYQAEAAGTVPVLDGLAIEDLSSHNATAKLDLLLALRRSLRGLSAALEYSTDLFERATMERFRGHFERLLEGLVRHPERHLSRLDLLAEAERRQIAEASRAPRDYEQADESLHGLFAAQVARTPEATALIWEGGEMTYRELAERSATLARRLAEEHDVGPEVRVAVAFERSPELMVALYAVAGAGAAYVPLDPSYPPERLRAMVEGSGARVVLTDGAVLDRLGDAVAGREVIRLDELSEPVTDGAAWPEVPVDGENLAYVIFTSGSTGAPKGAMNRHRSIVNRLLWMQERFRLDAHDRVLQKTPVSFDVSVWELFWPLLAGATLVLARPEGHRDPAYLARVIRDRRVTTLHFVPSMLRAFLDSGEAAQTAPVLERVIASGETLDGPLADRFFELLGDGVELHNLYGPTEAAVDVTAWRAEPTAATGAAVPIGRPIANSQIHLADRRLRLVPLGVAGELLIGGVGLGRGYLGDPARTAAAFVPDPWSGPDRLGARLYRTGDLARRRADGAVEFVGRFDHQVKVRGVRIELGEVTAAVSSHPAVREAAVVDAPGPGGGLRLVAYLVLEAGAEMPGPDAFRGFLEGRLPAAMVPQGFVALDSLPLLPNGKLDRRALAAVETDAAEALPRGRHVAPRTDIERALAEVWSEVLERDRVGVEDDFFALGGDSILSIQVVARAAERGISLSLPQIFTGRTIAAIAAIATTAEVARDASTAGAHEPFSLVRPEDRRRLPDDLEDAYPLTRLQAGMLYHAELDEAAPAYHNVSSMEIVGAFDQRRFRRAVERVVARHGVLRTSFDFTTASEPLQLVHRRAEPSLTVVDLTAVEPDDREPVVAEALAAEARRRFPLDEAPQIRFLVHLMGPGRYRLTVTENHAILDGWSLHATFDEIYRLYLADLDGAGDGAVDLRSTPTVSFAEFVRLERAALADPEARRFWEERLEQARPTPLPRWPRRSIGDDTAGTRHRGLDLPRELEAALARRAADEGVPVKTLYLAAHLAVLARLTGESRVTSGLVTHGRPEVAGGEEVRGLFLNTVPFVAAPFAAGSWRHLIRRVHAGEAALLPHRRYPMAALQERRGGEALFDVSFNYVHFHVASELLREGGVEVGSFDRSEASSLSLGVTVFADPAGSGTRLLLDATAALPEEQVTTAGELLVEALGRLAAAPEAPVDVLPEALRRRWAVDWAEGPALADEQPGSGTVVERIRRAVAERPDTVAVRAAGEEITHRELGRRSRRLAAALAARGIGPEDRVALWLPRSVELVAALVGVLDAGAAYVPLDLSWSAERLAELTAAAGCRAVVLRSDDPLAASVPAGVATIEVDRPGDPEHPAEPAPSPDPRSLAYVIFTSGSTGTPKGVAVEHRQLDAYVRSALQGLDLPAGGSFGVVGTLAADLGLTSLYPALATGGTVELATVEEATDPARFADWMGRNRPDSVKIVPTHLAMLLRHRAAAEVLPGRCLVLGGEAPSAELVAAVTAAVPDLAVHNHYGPTESTVGSVAGRLGGDGWPSLETAPLGRPLPGERALVLAPDGRLLPTGVPGELHLGGAGVSRGYLGRPADTARAFLPDPYADLRGEPGARLYATGDRARWLPDGRLEFLGRVDDQLKIRGHRVEPAEVTAALSDHPAVAGAFVVGRPTEHGGTELVAYLVTSGTSDVVPDGADLRRHAAGRLPRHMVPSRWVWLDELPLTPNGKVDRRALPAPDDAGEAEIAARGGATAPRSAAEELLAGIWQRLLPVASVSGDDDFFDLGGHSLLAVELVFRVRDAFDLDLPVAILFEHHTLSGLAAAIDARLKGLVGLDAPPLEPVPRDRALPQSFAQQRLWLMGQIAGDALSYSIPQAVGLDGELDLAALHRTFADLVRRHEPLRTTFGEEAGEPVQRIVPPRPLPLPVVDLSALDEPRREAERARIEAQEAGLPFDLGRGPVIRVRLVRLAPERHLMLLTLHHIVGDAWSLRVLVREASELYRSHRAGETPELPELPVQYADYAAWQRDLLSGERLERLLAYWRRQLDGLPPVLELPHDRPRPEVQRFRGANHMMSLPAETSDRIEELARREGATLYMVLLSAFSAVLGRVAGQEQVAIGADIAGRDRAETESMIGFFVNEVVLRMDLAGDPTFSELVARARETSLGAYLHQELPFLRVVEEMAPERSLGHLPLFQVSLVLNYGTTEAPELGDLELLHHDVTHDWARMDLSLNVVRLAEGLQFWGLYDTDLFDRQTAVGLFERFRALLDAAAAAPDEPLSRLLATVEDRERRRAGRDRSEIFGRVRRRRATRPQKDDR